MYSRTTAVITVLLVFAFLIGACSRDTAPVTPGTEIEAQSNGASQTMNWGTWDVSIDTTTGEIETVPLRGVDFTANVVRFLQPPVAPINLVSMEYLWYESNVPEGLISMNVTLRHPFPGMTQFRGFDVRGIIHSDGGTLGIYDPNVNYYNPEGTRLLNADGYTRWWNQVEFTTYGKIFGYTEGRWANPNFEASETVCPYKLFTPSLEPNQPYYQMDLSQRATFPVVDGVATRCYRMQFDTSFQPIFRFKYSIAASWSMPDPAYDPEYPIEAYDELANCQEAYMVRVTEYEEIPYYVDEYVSGGDLIFQLTIGDWQAQDGDVLSEISHVWLESNTLFEFPIDVRDMMEYVESPHPTQATYRISLEDMAPKGLQDQLMLITVESADPVSFEPQIEGSTAGWDYPADPLAAYAVADVPITNLTPTGEYAYCYFLPDWCATMRYQCTWDEQGPSGEGSQNQLLMANLISQNVEGYYNDYTHVQSWEGKTTYYVWGQNSDALADTCASLGYTFERTQSGHGYFDPSGSRVVIAVVWSNINTPLDPPFTEDEARDMQEFIDNGGILMFMCEATHNIHIQSLDNIFEWLGMLMEYGGGATPELTDGYTRNITWHWLTDNVDLYHYFTCGEWITEDPHVLTLVATELDEKAVLMYPLPLE